MSDVKQDCMDCSDNDYVYFHEHVVTIENVQEAIRKLKSGESYCVDFMTLCHGIAPTAFLLSMLVPILKNKRGNKCDSNNYRQIATVFDIIILDSQSKSLATDVLHFGFKKSSSTVNCTLLMLETIDYYLENNTDCNYYCWMHLPRLLITWNMLNCLLFYVIGSYARLY